MVGKPWGVAPLPPPFAGEARSDGPTGEVWFEGAADLPLMIKYIFTSEKLSIQVHPDDAEARRRGHAHGKDECWYVIDAEPDARLAIGTREPLAPDRLRQAALDGSLEQLMDWKPVERGDFFYIPAGTVHAIGAGVSLIECQQNIDLTYRLYDYGRPRELHLDDAVAVARAGPYDDRLHRKLPPSGTVELLDGPFFSLVRIDGRVDLFPVERIRGPFFLVPLAAPVMVNGETVGPGDCALLPDATPLVGQDVGLSLLAGLPG